jgi:hypothetical protein
MSRLIISARYWNNEDWIEASLKHVEAWEADEVYISEGNWDKNFEAKSKDRTRKIIEDFSSYRSNYNVFDNPRVFDNYRQNQALTSNSVMVSAKVEVGDWMLIIDADHFYSKEDIIFIKKLMQENYDFFDYFTHETFCFLRSIDEYTIYFDDLGTKLPYRIISKYCQWIPTNHLSYEGKMYKDLKEAREFRVKVNGLHYEAQMSKERFQQKYSIGNRKTPEASGRFKNFLNYAASHNEFAIPVLEEYGYKFDSKGYLI